MEHRTPPPPKRRRPQRGVFAIMFAALLPFILALLGLGLGLAQVYNRKVELQAVANAAALAAARELNGTGDGLSAAMSAAAATARRFTTNYSSAIVWSDSALTFGPSASGPWGNGDPNGAGATWYVKVDTARLGGAGLLKPIFAQFLEGVGTVDLGEVAIAGRSAIKVMPLAVCALSPQAASARGAELVQYGFRRGVVYDLKKLNPDGIDPQHFIIDPLIAPGSNSTVDSTSLAKVGPFVCAGALWMPSVLGGPVRVNRTIHDELYKHLNSRFGQYEDRVCDPNGAPADMNIRPLTGTWMSPNPASPATASYQTTSALRTIADQASPPSGTTATQWGALWAHAKAVRFSAYDANEDEPPNGYRTFEVADMPSLYQTGVSAPNYPQWPTGSTPYLSLVTPAGNRRLAEEKRRILHIPLLSCPVPAGARSSATVLAVGKFFMVVPATASSIVAEFGGIAAQSTLSAQVELFQ